MNRRLATVATVFILALSGSCGLIDRQIIGLPVETQFHVLNFSRQYYVTARLREHVAEGEPKAYGSIPLLAPGVTERSRFLDVVGNGCPESLDLQILLYRRVNADMPIGLDEGEVVESTPVVAGEILDLPACNIQALETYTIVSWDAPEGTARVKLAQETEVDAEIRRRGIFAEPDAAWEITGVDPVLADLPPPPLADSESIAGQVALADGTGVEGIGVLIRTQFRVRLTDEDSDNDPDVGFGDPIIFTNTAADGRFTFSRPPGAYQVEFFADDFLLRPDSVILESPVQVITIVAEPIQP